MEKSNNLSSEDHSIEESSEGSYFDDLDDLEQQAKGLRSLKPRESSAVGEGAIEGSPLPPESLAAVDKVNEHFLEEDAPTPGPPGGSRSTQFRKRDSARKQTTLFFEETMYNNFCRNYADFKTIIGASAGKRETVIESFFSDTFDPSDFWDYMVSKGLAPDNPELRQKFLSRRRYV